MAVEPGSFEETAGRIQWACRPEAGLPNVLLLGDSISIGYTPGVREALHGTANVYRPVIQTGSKKGAPQNCVDTSTSLNNLSQWLAAADRWDVIHFNWGLHDLRRNRPDCREGSPDLPNNVDIETYEKNLQMLVDRLKQTGARLIFAQTTPVPEGVVPCRLPEDAERYNEVALRVMVRNGVEINDLYTLTKDRLKEIQQPNNVHFNDKGNQLLAGAVAEKITDVLSNR